MKFKVGKTFVSVSYPAVAFCSLAIVSAPDSKVVLCLLSALFHECGHLSAMYFYRVSVKEISFNLGDVSINTDETVYGFRADVVVTLSGVAVNFLLALISGVVWLLFESSILLDFAVANLCIGFFNILPLSTLDGGNLLLILLQRHFSISTSEKILSVITAVFLAPLLIVGFLMLFAAKNNFSLLFAALYLIYIFVSKEIR